MDKNNSGIRHWPMPDTAHLWVVLTGIPAINFVGWGIAAYRFHSLEYGFACVCIGVLNVTPIIWFAVEAIPSNLPVFLSVVAIVIYPISFMDAVVTERVYGRFQPGGIAARPKLTPGIRGGWGRWWIVWTSFPVLNLFAWVLAALRYRSLLYLFWAVFYSLPTVVLISEPLSDIGTTFWIIAYFATYPVGMIHALMVPDPIGDNDYMNSDVMVPVMERDRIYSPTQAGFGSLFGPIAASYFVWKNFRILGRPAEAKQAALWGIFISISSIIVLPFLTSIIPVIIILLCYAVTVRTVVERLQVKEEQVADSNRYPFETNPKVILIGLSGLALNVALMGFGNYIEHLVSG